jgi:hypothetical protein
MNTSLGLNPPRFFMRKALPIIFFTTICCISGQAQGTVNFENILLPVGINAPVYQSDRVTPLSGSQFMAELLAGPTANNLASIATTGFFTGPGAGYFSGGQATINSVSPGATAWIEVRVWNTGSGDSFLQALTSGLPNSWWRWPVFTVATGGGFQGPPPAPLTGLGTSPVYLNSVPEPTTTALLELGTILAVFRFRRRDRWAVSNH